MPVFDLFLSPPHQSGKESAFIAEALASNYLAPTGPMVERFEQDFADYVDARHCIALSSGTAALHLALRYRGVGRGDEVWAATLTFIGSVAPVVMQGAELVFLDCDDSWTLDPELLAEALKTASRRGRLPRAVIPTDLYGQSCDLDAIRAVCDAHGVPVICDSAEAVGTLYKGRAAGQGAWAAAYSFNGNKIITTSGGGILTTDDALLAEAARKLSTQAREAAPHYEHREVGYNYRLSNISAAIGCAQLEVIEQRVARRRAIFDRYRRQLEDLPGLSFMPEKDHGGSRATRWLTAVLIDPLASGVEREDLRLALEAARIEARPVWKPMHLQPVFAGSRRIGGATAERFFAQGLCLPSGSAMSDGDVDRVVAVIRESFAAGARGALGLPSQRPAAPKASPRPELVVSRI